MDDKTIERAGRMFKIIELARTPGMDIVAVKLNSGLTYQEKERAKRWAKAFDLAAELPPDAGFDHLVEAAGKL